MRAPRAHTHHQGFQRKILSEDNLQEGTHDLGILVTIVFLAVVPLRGSLHFFRLCFGYCRASSCVRCDCALLDCAFGGGGAFQKKLPSAIFPKICHCGCVALMLKSVACSRSPAS